MTFQPEALPHWDDAFASMAKARPDFATAACEHDRVARGSLVTPARSRQSAAARAARGLVSVPTTETRVVPAPVQAVALRSELRAFALDPEARRLSQLRMHVGFAARAHAVSRKGHRADVPWMVTLTYRGDNNDWRPDHIKAALQACRKWCQRRGAAFRYVWVAELQQRGVIHYHVACWLPKGLSMPKWDKQGWWPHGMTNVIRARHATAYLMKYLSKGSDYGQLPRGARAYAVGGLDHSLRRARAWLRLPSFVQGNASIFDRWTRREGGGWIAPDGAAVASEFTSAVVAGVRCLLRVFTHPRAIDAAGPFSWLTDRETALSFA